MMIGVKGKQLCAGNPNADGQTDGRTDRQTDGHGDSRTWDKRIPFFTSARKFDPELVI